MSLGKFIKQSLTDRGQEDTLKLVEGAVKSGKIRRDEFSLRDLAENIIGPGWDIKLQRYAANPMTSPCANPMAFRGSENADAVDASTFASITGNQLIDTVKEKYKSPAFIGQSLVSTIPVANGNLDTQKEPWLSDVTTAADLLDTDDLDEDVVEPGMPFNRTKFSPNYHVLQRPKKRSVGIDVTFEMIYADRTRQAYDSAASVGKRLGRSKEYRILKVVLGCTRNFVASFGGAAEATYSTYIEDASGLWSNHIDSRELLSWADLNAVEQKFNEMRDPVTGEPIDIEADTLLVMPAKYHTARHIVHATGIRVGPGGSTTSGDGTASTVNYSSSDLKQYNIVTSKYAYKLIAANCKLFKEDSSSATITAAQAANVWYVGNFPKAFYYREVYPLRVIPAPNMNPAEYDRDIVLSLKAMEFGVAGVRDPRHVCRVMDFAFDSVA